MAERKVIGAFLRTAPACELLHVSANTLRNWADQGLVGCVRVGKRQDRLFPLHVVLRLAKQLEAERSQSS